MEIHIYLFWTKDNASNESLILSGNGVIVDEMHILINTVTTC